MSDKNTKREENAPFDIHYFENQEKNGKIKLVKDKFSHIYDTNHWSGGNSVSCAGSNKVQTSFISEQLPLVLKEFGINTLLDLPCGDFNWMNSINLEVENYIGGDIVDEIVNSNSKKYANNFRKFEIFDLTNDSLPDADLLLCRDCFVHLSFVDIFMAIENIKRSNITYLLTTSFTNCRENFDITTGDWRVLNLENAPFYLPKPIRLINENCSEHKGLFKDKCLGMWRVDDL